MTTITAYDIYCWSWTALAIVVWQVIKYRRAAVPLVAPVESGMRKAVRDMASLVHDLPWQEHYRAFKLGNGGSFLPSGCDWVAGREPAEDKEHLKELRADLKEVGLYLARGDGDPYRKARPGLDHVFWVGEKR